MRSGRHKEARDDRTMRWPNGGGDGHAWGGVARGTPGSNEWGGANRRGVGSAVDRSGRREEAWLGRNHAEAEAAMVDDGEHR